MREAFIEHARPTILYRPSSHIFVWRDNERRISGSPVFVLDPCGKQHLRETARRDWVGHFTNRRQHTAEYGLISVYSLPNQAWLFLANVVSHMVLDPFGR